MWVVWVVEAAPPDGVPPVEWILVTTVAVTTTAQALTVVDWYCCRWGIEVWHKALKLSLIHIW